MTVTTCDICGETINTPAVEKLELKSNLHRPDPNGVGEEVTPVRFIVEVMDLPENYHVCYKCICAAIRKQ